MFTDKQLKTFVKRINYLASLSTWTEGPFEIREFQGILNRLSAAEAVCQHLQDRESEKVDINSLEAHLYAWRKSCGREVKP